MNPPAPERLTQEIAELAERLAWNFRVQVYPPVDSWDHFDAEVWTGVGARGNTPEEALRALLARLQGEAEANPEMNADAERGKP